MPRKTKEERQAEAAAAEAADLAREKEEYPVRLMGALERATQENNYELTVKDGIFVLHDRDGEYDSVRLTWCYTAESQQELGNLGSYLHSKAWERDEEERRRLVREAAWAKLTPEERTLLGVKQYL